MSDNPVPLPITQREIDDAVDNAFDDVNRTVPTPRGQASEMFSLEPLKTDNETTTIDPIVRLEQKLDSVLRAVEVLKRKIDSIDLTLVQIINR